MDTDLNYFLFTEISYNFNPNTNNTMHESNSFFIKLTNIVYFISFLTTNTLTFWLKKQKKPLQLPLPPNKNTLLM